jgi:hypothetical protein
MSGKKKVVLWLQDPGTYEDQFGTEKDCTIVRQQVVAELVNTSTREGGYGQPVRIYKYEDSLGRTFTFMNRGISYTGPGRTYSCAAENFEGTWKEPKKLDRNAPYITPDGKHEVEIIDTEHDPEYEFYESTQMSI